MKKLIFFTMTVFMLIVRLQAEPFNLTAFWDSTTVLENPDKGWYHHYYDNGIDHYLLNKDADLDNIPGMDHLYLRLAWSFLEPKEGEFNWELIDKVINKWVAKGYTISFRISCRETGLDFATPAWLYKMGLPGTFIDNWGLQTFEPDYGHPLFLEKLEQFHRVFAERYDGQPWLAYVDIGSYGDWGEGHTSFGTKVAWSNEVLKKHIDIHLKNYKRTPIVVSDDFLQHRSEADAAELRQYIDENGIAWRDDSILVGWYVDVNAETYSVSDPKIFRDSWPTRPTIVELQHYQMIIDDGNWKGQDGSVRGAEILWGACDIMHPTWIGYHGYADQWLKDNPNLTRQLANKVGYWYFLKSVDIPELVRPGLQTTLTLEMENHGYAPAYKKYRMLVKLEGSAESYEQYLTEIDNRTWMPGETAIVSAALFIPSSLPMGDYKVKLKMVKDNLPVPRTVYLALQDKFKDQNGFYEVGSVTVKGSAANESPEIKLNIQPSEGLAPLEVGFDASGSSDADGDALTFFLDFCDGAGAEGAVVSHTYAYPNGYTAILNVVDDRGSQAQAARRLNVTYTPPPLNRMPLLKVTVDRTSGGVPLSVTLNASSSTDPDGDVLTFRWDFGDGVTAEGAVVTHQYLYTGEYTATLTIDDGHEIYNDAKKNFAIMAGASALLTGKVIGTEGSRNNSGNTIDKVFDGDPSTFFDAPERDGAWVGLDLDMGKGKTAHIVKIAYYPAENKSARMTNGVFQGANATDFSDAVNLFTILEKPVEGSRTVVVLNNTQPFRFVRYLGPARSYGVVAELEFYGAFLTDVQQEAAPAIHTFQLEQNYPNPFNPTTTIRYQLPAGSQVKLELFNLNGALAQVHLDNEQLAGSHEVSFDGSRLAAGVYFYRLSTPAHTAVRRMLLLK